MEHALTVGIDCSDEIMIVAYIADAKPYNLVISNGVQLSSIACDRGESISSLGVRFPNLRGILGTRKAVEYGARIQAPEDIVERSIASIYQSLLRVEGKPIDEVVMAVPASLGQNGRRALIDCCHRANFPRVSLIDRCSAAAIGYYGDRERAMTCLVYDLGYGEFEYALVRLAKGRCRVLTSGILSHVSGEYLDAVLMEAVVLALREKNLFLGLKKWTSHQWMQFRNLAEDARLALRQESHTDIVLAPALTKLKENIQVRLYASSFNESIAPLIDRTIEVIQGALESNALELTDVDAVLVVGNVAQKPPVLDRLVAAFPQSLLSLERDVVANGSALYASRLAKSRSEATGQADTEKSPESDNLLENSVSEPVRTEAESQTATEARANIAEVITTEQENTGQVSSLPVSQNPLLEDDSLQTARRLIQQGHSEKALVLLNQISREVDELRALVSLKEDTPARAVLREAQASLEEQNYNEAVILSHQAYDLDKNDPWVFTTMLQIHVQAGLKLDRAADYENAINLLKCALVHDPTDRSVRSAMAERHYRHALAMKNQNRVPECLGLLLDVLNYAPKHQEALELQRELTPARGLASST